VIEIDISLTPPFSKHRPLVLFILAFAKSTCTKTPGLHNNYMPEYEESDSAGKKTFSEGKHCPGLFLLMTQ